MTGAMSAVGELFALLVSHCYAATLMSCEIYTNRPLPAFQHFSNLARNCIQQHQLAHTVGAHRVCVTFEGFIDSLYNRASNEFLLTKPFYGADDATYVLHA